MITTTRSKEVSKIVERSAHIERRKKLAQKMLTISMIREQPKNKVINAWADLKKMTGTKSRDFPTQNYYTHEKLVEKYPNRTWSGSRCFIIGGGPSLKGFDFSKLNNELTIAVNRAYEYFDSNIIFFIDHTDFYQQVIKGEFGKEAKDKFITSRALKIALNIGGMNFDHGTYSVPLSKEPQMTFDLKDGLFDGDNSGFAALNLAVCLGATTIYLLGYDMKGDGKGNQAWFHSGYKKIGKERSYVAWIKHFEDAEIELRRRSIRVVNLNAESNLKCFEIGKFEDIKDLGSGYEYVPEYDSKLLIRYKYESLYFEGTFGFGDNFYQRPIIKDLAKSYKTIYLRTALPEMYWDIPNVEFIYPEGLSLRTQMKHVKSLPKETWSDLPKKVDSVRWDQMGPSSARKIQTKYVELENQEDFDFTFPVRNEWVRKAKKLIESLSLNGKKLCIVRRPTNRKEWNCPARNPKIEYYQLLIDRYGGEYYFLGLADIKKDEEWFDGKLYGIDKEFNHGEISLTTIFGLMKISDMIITYPSFFMIAAIGIRAKCFCIFGGASAPFNVIRKNFDLSNFEYVATEPFCNCNNMTHDCNKEISVDLILKTFEALKNRDKVIKHISIGTPPGIGDSYWVMTKMQSFKERNAIDHLTIVVHRDPIHYYTADYLNLFPFIDEVKGTEKHYREFAKHWDKESPSCIKENIADVDYLIDFGGYMWITGTPLNEIHPEYETNYKLPMNLSPASKEFVSAIKEKNNNKLVLFYTSAIGNNANWNQDDWKYENWMALINLIHEHSGIRPIAIGAEWDRDYIDELKKLDKNGAIQDFVGGIDIQLTLSMIKEANLVMGFACGIPIIATYSGVPTVIFYAIKGISKCNRFEESFQYAWTPPEIKNSDKYIPVAYGDKETTPEKIFERVKKFL